MAGRAQGTEGQDQQEKRVRINKRQMQQLLKERDAFKMAYTEI